MKIKFSTFFITTFFLLLLQACGSNRPVPVINKSPNRVIPQEITVQPGQSIYSISWQYGLDYLKIAKWNGMKKPYKLQPGQKVSLRQGPKVIPAAPQEPVVSAPLPAEPATNSAQPSAVKPAPSQTASKQPPKPALKPPSRWRWPAKGEVIAKFSRKKNINGIQIAGQSGSAITSTAAGDVVYVGDGLKGYGKLVIIKHSAKFLSAYAHNRQILVKEGDRVGAGDKIAEMGNSGATRTMLHFEIRVNGKPEDPLNYLKG